MIRARSLSILGVIALAACAEPPTNPSAVATGRPLAHANAAGKHLVFFNSKAPADFSDRVAALGGAVDASYDGVGVAVVSGLNESAAADLASTSGVNAVEMDHEYQILPDVGTPDVTAADVVAASPTNPAGAFFYARQWHLRQIKADAAWAAGNLGSPEVRVAILDTGIDYLHADLAGRVDLSRSVSFIPSDDALVDAFFPGRHHSTDLRFHGTHVAATVASNGNAAAGVTSMTTLMSVKVLNVNGSGSAAGILAGIVFAVDNGAHIINMSLGFQNPLPEATFRPFAKTLNRAFQYAHANGVAVIVAAGNEAYNVDTKGFFKLLCENVHVTCVSATGPTSSLGVNGPWTNLDSPAVYTNFGVKSISIAAPGGNTGGAVTAACSGTSLVIPVCQTGTFVVGVNGTSMASPHAAGVAALILAQRGSMPPGALRSILENQVDDLGPSGKDAFYGRGRINAAKALGLE